MLRSTAGCPSVSSQITQAANPTMAQSDNTTIIGLLNQSRSLPRSSTVCRLNTQKASRIRPMVSIGSLRVGVSRAARWRQVARPARMPTGTLMKKIQPQ